MKRKAYPLLLKRLEEKRQFIQVLLGPRQVGKTTTVLELAEEISIPVHYASADVATLKDITWIRTQWEVARENVDSDGIFIIDEIQKIPGWSEAIKALWDEDTKTSFH